MDYDVAIIGGGPAGATAGTLLKKYHPNLRVAIFEKEKFPRDHIGESQLPAISAILDEMGVWDKVEAANFPIKIGSTNRWGKNPELWDLEFIPSEMFMDEPRPAKFEGQRRYTAFQVDRAIYDKILLDHAAEFGVDVHEETGVRKIHQTGDHVDALELESGESVKAKHYVDASGHTGVLRRAMGVGCTYPSTLQNVAFWDYWQNAEWAVKIGVGATKVQVMSLGWGWIWFIPLGPTRTSVGLVVPANYYKERGLRPQELYLEALAQEERISALLKSATREHKFETTKDWSFLADRQSGDNWFLAGESAGFADPVLAAGMTMAHAAGREVAFTILELERGILDSEWLREHYDQRQSQRVWSHIRFADFWYTANAQFVDIKECVQDIAKDAGLDLSPDNAWRWLAQGGFIDEDLTVGVGGFSFFLVKGMSAFLADLPSQSPLEQFNVFHLDLTGASFRVGAKYQEGHVIESQCYVREGKTLPVDGRFELIVNVLQRESSLDRIADAIKNAVMRCEPGSRERVFTGTLEAFEAMISDGWVKTGLDLARPRFKLSREDKSVRLNKDTLHSA
jgi:flavin-dependent dehydrogenase